MVGVRDLRPPARCRNAVCRRESDVRSRHRVSKPRPHPRRHGSISARLSELLGAVPAVLSTAPRPRARPRPRVSTQPARSVSTSRYRQRPSEPTLTPRCWVAPNPYFSTNGRKSRPCSARSNEPSTTTRDRGGHPHRQRPRGTRTGRVARHGRLVRLQMYGFTQRELLARGPLPVQPGFLDRVGGLDPAAFLGQPRFPTCATTSTWRCEVGSRSSPCPPVPLLQLCSMTTSSSC